MKHKPLIIAALVAVVLLFAGFTMQTRQQWEYRSLTVAPSDESLNGLASEGWELVFVHTDVRGQTRHYFKRAK